MGKTAKRRETGSFLLRINGIAVILLLSATLSGLTTDIGAATFEYHVVLGLSSSVIGLFALTLLLFYIITTGGYIKEGIKVRNLDKTLINRLSGIKARLFPHTLLTLLLLIGSPVAGAMRHTGNDIKLIHLLTAIGTALVYILLLRRAKVELEENKLLAEEVVKTSPVS